MKKILLPILLLFVITVQGQSGGPDAFGYHWRDSNHPQGPTYSWIDITSLPGATLVTGLTDDNTSNFYPIGFSFPYYWYTVSQFKVGSNGYVIFNNGAIASPFPTIPSASLPNDFVAPMMCDLNFGNPGNPAECWYWSNNVDTLIVSYINTPFWVNATPAHTGSNTFQVILSAADSSITFQYQTQQGTSPGTTNFLSIGMENNSGNIGLQYSYNIYPPQLYAVKFYYPDSSNFVVNDASTAYNNNPETGALFLSKDGAPFTMNTRVKNTGNQSLSSFGVNMEVINSGGVPFVRDTLFTSPLTPGQTEDLVSSDLFYPTIADRITFRSTTLLSGDVTSTNDSRSLELVVVDTTQILFKMGYTQDFPVPTSAGISWTGGDAGIGIEVVPPFYPIYIHKLEFYITANLQSSAFAARVFNYHSGDTVPGTLVDSIYVPGLSVLAPEEWNYITLANPIRIDSGSVFVEWVMGGEGVTLGTDNFPPISNRTYEIHGAWAIFRYREDRDPMIRVVASSLATTGINDPSPSTLFGEFFPSPSSERVYIDHEMKAGKDLVFSFYNMQGQLVSSVKSVSVQQRHSFDVSKWNAGIYICTISDGKNSYNRKLTVTK